MEDVYLLGGTVVGTIVVFLIFAVSLLVTVGLYFLPGIIALIRGSRLTAPVIVLNILLGWTLLGWVVAMVMAAWPEPPRRRRY